MKIVAVRRIVRQCKTAQAFHFDEAGVFFNNAERIFELTNFSYKSNLWVFQVFSGIFILLP